MEVMTDIKLGGIAEFEKVSFNEYYKSRNPKAFPAYDQLGEDAIRDMIYEEWANIKLPQRATTGSAGYDFYLPHSIHLDSTPRIIRTGICCAMNPGWVLLLFPRSGLGYKYGVRLSNATGVIDCDFYHNPDNEGHISAKMYAADSPVNLDAGDRFMQGVFVPYGTVIDDGAVGQRTGGTGSTGH